MKYLLLILSLAIFNTDSAFAAADLGTMKNNGNLNVQTYHQAMQTPIYWCVDSKTHYNTNATICGEEEDCLTGIATFSANNPIVDVPGGIQGRNMSANLNVINETYMAVGDYEGRTKAGQAEITPIVNCAAGSFGDGTGQQNHFAQIKVRAADPMPICGYDPCNTDPMGAPQNAIGGQFSDGYQH